MNTFLKIALLAILALVTIKISPVIFFFAAVGLVAAAVLGAVGFSLMITLLAIGVALAFALSPIWVPVLLVLGAISLFRRTAKSPLAPHAAAT